MRKLYDANPGLKRRCPNEVFFDDFNNEELKEIFMQQMKNGEYLHVKNMTKVKN